MDARRLYRAVFNLSLSVQELLDVLQEEIQREQREQLEELVNDAETYRIESDRTKECVEEISVSLLSARTGQVPTESQVNAAFSKHYNAGQAMIYVPMSSWHFFPQHNVPFTVKTDDEKQLTLKIVGTSSRSLVTTNSYRILSEYLRGRLGIKLNAPITREMLEEYGRTDIVVRKVNGEYFLDFSS